MNKFKKILMYISGPGMVLVEVIAIFIQIFTEGNARSWMIGAFVIFIVVFIPLYFVEYYKQNLREAHKRKPFQFNKRNTRTEWVGGNIRGKVPKEVERPGKLFQK